MPDKRDTTEIFAQAVYIAHNKSLYMDGERNHLLATHEHLQAVFEFIYRDNPEYYQRLVARAKETAGQVRRRALTDPSLTTSVLAVR